MTAAAGWCQAANQGDTQAQFNIGTLHALGVGVGKDEIRAAEWRRRAANNLLPQAWFNLAVQHEERRGVELYPPLPWSPRKLKPKHRIGRLESIQKPMLG